jgi:hypothetical protein
VSEQSESGGVFGNLPRSRPGTRSPLREPDSPPPASAPASGPEPAEPPPPMAEARDEPPAREQPSEAQPGDPDAPEGGGLEDLAWAGIAAAAEAATIGVRLASRAMEAVRDAGKRT